MSYNFATSPFNYPPGSNIPIARVKQNRAPTAGDNKNFIPGDEWLDTAGNDWWKLVKVTQGVALWVKVGSNTGVTESLTGNTGGPVDPDGSDNINVVGDNTTISIAGNPGTHTLTASVIGGIRYPITPYVVGPMGQAGYQTIQSAINAAHAAGGGMVFVQNGTYTENLTFFDNIQLFGDSESATYIVGTHVPPSSGILNVNRVTFQSSNNVFSSNAAGTSQILVEDTTFNVTNGYSFNLPNWTGQIQLFNIGNFGTNDGGINNTGGCEVFIFSAGFGNGSANHMILSGFTEFANGIEIGCPINLVTGCNFTSYGSVFDGSITISNNATASFNHDTFNTGSTPAITQSSSGAVKITNATINTSNNPAIAGSGAGTLTIGTVTFVNNANIAGTLTLSYVNTTTGPIRASNISFDFGANLLKTYQENVSFTPTIYGGTTAGTATYNTQYGVYSRIGNMVFVQVNLVWTGHTGTGTMNVAGFPYIFAAAASVYPMATLLQNIALPAGATTICVEGTNNDTTADILATIDNASLSAVQMSAAGSVFFCGMYLTVP